MQNMHWNCYDLRTGRKLWQSEQTSYPWGNWWPYATASYDINETKGCIISGSYAGVYAFDWDNGKILWHYADPDVPFESPYGNTPFQSGCRIADGKVYIYNTEHSASQPATRGWKLYCLNAATGELLWKILGPMSPGAVADGYLTASNSYDGYMYVFGRGKSATTVTAPDVAVPLGTAFTIKGTVLDQSPGQPGTPCVSKDSMETQMEYLHMSRPIDGLWHNESITGVPVTLTAIGSDGSVIDLGSVTTNGYYGTFSKAWTPPKEDTYTIIASFGADDSYGSSNAATAVTVGPAPAPYPETPEAPTPPDYTMLLYGILVAVIIAIVLALVLIFRKR
jgi:outer membrane protein assembly factor BamB